MSDDVRNLPSGGAGSSPPSDVHASRKGAFRREAEYWTVGYGERSYRLKDSKGLAYIAHLLRHPDVSFHVLDLVGGIPSQTDQTKNNQIGLPRGGEDLDRLQKARPQSVEPDPEQAVDGEQPEPTRPLAAKNVQLMTESEVL